MSDKTTIHIRNHGEGLLTWNLIQQREDPGMVYVGSMASGTGLENLIRWLEEMQKGFSDGTEHQTDLS